MGFRVTQIYEHVQGSRINLSKKEGRSQKFFWVYSFVLKALLLLGLRRPAGGAG